MRSKWENKGESCHRCVDIKETKLLRFRWRMSQYSRDLEQKQDWDYGTAGVLATSQSEKTKVKENSLTPGEWEEWKLADKQSKLTTDNQTN